jgi:hypothetical protein
MVEAAVVIPSFIILLGGMLFLHHVVREQQRVMHAARNEAWTSAMKSCHGDGNDVPQPDFTSTMPGAPGANISLQNNLGMASGSAEASVSVSSGGSPTSEAGGLFSFNQSVQAKAVVFCNNQTASGDIGGVFGWLVDNVKGLLGK